MKPHIQRLLADRIRGLAAHFPVVLVTGARQTGKTTLLRDLFPEAPFQTLDLPSVAHEAEHNRANSESPAKECGLTLD